MIYEVQLSYIRVWVEKSALLASEFFFDSRLDYRYVFLSLSVIFFQSDSLKLSTTWQYTYINSTSVRKPFIYLL